MYKYVRINESKKIVGMFLSEENMHDPESPARGWRNVIQIPDNHPGLYTICAGWRLGDDGNWLPPEPPSEESVLKREIRDISGTLKRTVKRERLLADLGIDPNSDIAKTLAPEVPVKIREPKRRRTLAETYARMAGGKAAKALSEASKATAVAAKAERLIAQTPHTKQQLLSSLLEKQNRLNQIMASKA